MIITSPQEEKIVRQIRDLLPQYRREGSGTEILPHILRELRRMRRLLKTHFPEGLLDPKREAHNSVKEKLITHSKKIGAPGFSVEEFRQVHPEIRCSMDSLRANLHRLARVGILKKERGNRPDRRTIYRYRDLR